MKHEELLKHLEREFLNIIDLETYASFLDKAAEYHDNAHALPLDERIKMERVLRRLAKSFRKSREWLMNTEPISE